LLPSDAALSLENRSRLPDALRVLMTEFPRGGWQDNPRFEGLIRFWLERHMMFRGLLDAIETDTHNVLDDKMDTARFAARLARYGSIFVGELHGHHSVEDAHYFPLLETFDARLARGFSLLDADHHALDGHLQRFTEAVNAVLTSHGQADDMRVRTGEFDAVLQDLKSLLNRHLIDEEEIVVPVVLKYGGQGLV